MRRRFTVLVVSWAAFAVVGLDVASAAAQVAPSPPPVPPYVAPPAFPARAAAPIDLNASAPLQLSTPAPVVGAADVAASAGAFLGMSLAMQAAAAQAAQQQAPPSASAAAAAASAASAYFTSGDQVLTVPTDATWFQNGAQILTVPTSDLAGTTTTTSATFPADASSSSTSSASSSASAAAPVPGGARNPSLPATASATDDSQGPAAVSETRVVTPAIVVLAPADLSDGGAGDGDVPYDASGAPLLPGAAGTIGAPPGGASTSAGGGGLSGGETPSSSLPPPPRAPLGFDVAAALAIVGVSILAGIAALRYTRAHP